MTEKDFVSNLSIYQQDIFGDGRVVDDYKKAVIHFVNEESEIAWNNPRKYGVRQSITEGINLAEQSLQSLEKTPEITLDLRHIYYKSSQKESILVLDTQYGICRYVLVLHRLGGKRLEDYATYVVKDIMTDRDTNQTINFADITDFGEETILWERSSCSNSGAVERKDISDMLVAVHFPIDELNF